MTSSALTIVVTIILAIFVALMARQLKISEFRQGWIDGIRKDTSEFMTKAHEWIDLYLKINGEEDQKTKAELSLKLDRIKYDAYHIFWRIQLRFKPDDTEANKLLSSLEYLLNPGKLTPDKLYYSWRILADGSVLKARYLLKEEWETTKNPFRKYLIKLSQKFRPNKSFNRTP